MFYSNDLYLTKLQIYGIKVYVVNRLNTALFILSKILYNDGLSGT